MPPRRLSMKAGPSSATPQKEKNNLRQVIEEALTVECGKFQENLGDYLPCGKGKGKGKKSKQADSDVNNKLNDVHENDAIAVRVSEVLLPLIAAQFEQIFQKCLESVVKVIQDERDQALAKAERSNLLLRYEIDRLEQYQRRETVKITGIEEKEDENIEHVVTKLFNDIGADIETEDISAVHRNGSKAKIGVAKKPRPILVKFTSRKKKALLMLKKKALKDSPQFKHVYFNDDLTPLRSRLLHKVKSLDTVQRVNTTHDGKIVAHLKLKAGQSKQEVIYVENPDDLFQLGVSEISYEELGLVQFVSSE